ncbi:PEP-CTERM sorting domain-containing protein [Massilia sp. TN1-12]|uniref:PEP-CTERM sorting domain-containing protein n=1 Tax=Massilia paldalensis TaxID=3377675 RepID=UPI00384C9FF4
MHLKSILLSLSAAAALSASIADAAPLLVTNGNFELTTYGGNKQLAANTTTAAAKGQTTLVGWTSYNGNDGGYNFLLNASTATTSASALQLKGGSNGFGASPGGGNFFASDPLYYPGYLFQTISGLTVGKDYTLTFDYALSQQAGFNGDNLNNYWQVGLGSTFQNTSMLSIANGGFSGWKGASMTFTATSTSEILSFLAKSSSSGAPPFLLLDDVKLESKVPEPSTLSLLLGGIGLAGFAARRRRAKRV